MQTVDYSKVEERLESLTGNDSFSTDEKAWIKSAFNRRIRMAYEESPFWPRYIKEELRYAGFDNVIPVDEESKDSIDTVLAVWDSDPRKRISTARRYEYATRFDGSQVLGLADGDNTDTVYTSTPTSISGDEVTSKNTSVKAVSFVLTANALSVGGPGTEQRNLLYANSEGSGVESGDATGKINFSFSTFGNVAVINDWVTSGGASMLVYADGILIGVDDGTGGVTVDIKNYFDGEPHHFVWTLSTNTTAFQYLRSIYYELNSTSGQTNDVDIQLADVRFLVDAVSADQAALMFSNQEKIYNQVAWASSLPQYWVSYKAQLPAQFGDASGEVSAIPQEFFEYAVHGAYADWLRAEGQTDKAMAEEGFARENLQRQLERIYYTSGSPALWNNFNTHSKSQSR